VLLARFDRVWRDGLPLVLSSADTRPQLGFHAARRGWI
jgi:hypothetical protein